MLPLMSCKDNFPVRIISSWCLYSRTDTWPKGILSIYNYLYQRCIDRCHEQAINHLFAFVFGAVVLVNKVREICSWSSNVRAFDGSTWFLNSIACSNCSSKSSHCISSFEFSLTNRARFCLDLVLTSFCTSVGLVLWTGVKCFLIPGVI